MAPDPNVYVQLPEEGDEKAPGTERAPYNPHRQSSMFMRMRFYHHLTAKHNDKKFHVPDSIATNRPVYAPPNLAKAGEGKQSSLVTIFGIWNTMMGSSLLALPWGFTQAGLLGGVLTMLVTGLINYYTSYLIVKHGYGYHDFFDLCRDTLGRTGEIMCWLSSLLVLIGALMAYDRLMSDCLFYFVNGIRQLSTDRHYGESELWSLSRTPFLIALIMFPLCNLKSRTLFVRLSSIGSFCVAYVIGFLLYAAFFQEGLTFEPSPPMFESNMAKFAGLLTLSFFIHNVVLPMMMNQRHPENNVRDLSIAFAFVAATYLVIGAAIFVAYHHVTIEEDFLNHFSDTAKGALVGRLALLFQLCSVFPLLMYIIRTQFFGLLYGTEYPSMRHVIGLNVFIMAVVTTVVIVYPHIGDILRFTGSGCGFLYVYLLPVAVHLLKEWSPHLPWIIKTPFDNLAESKSDPEAPTVDSAVQGPSAQEAQGFSVVSGPQPVGRGSVGRGVAPGNDGMSFSQRVKTYWQVVRRFKSGVAADSTERKSRATDVDGDGEGVNTGETKDEVGSLDEHGLPVSQPLDIPGSHTPEPPNRVTTASPRNFAHTQSPSVGGFHDSHRYLALPTPEATTPSQPLFVPNTETRTQTSSSRVPSGASGAESEQEEQPHSIVTPDNQASSVPAPSRAGRKSATQRIREAAWRAANLIRGRRSAPNDNSSALSINSQSGESVGVISAGDEPSRVSLNSDAEVVSSDQSDTGKVPLLGRRSNGDGVLTDSSSYRPPVMSEDGNVRTPSLRPQERIEDDQGGDVVSCWERTRTSCGQLWHAFCQLRAKQKISGVLHMMLVGVGFALFVMQFA